MMPRELQQILNAALAAVHPDQCLATKLPDTRPDLVLAAGKAASAMLVALARDGRAPERGLVVVPYGHRVAGDDRIAGIRVLEAAHPVPDAAGLVAGAEWLKLLADARPDEQVLVLLSGGASALLSAPAGGMSLGEEQQLTRELLASGVGIHDINIVRGHLSLLKAGRSAKVCEAGRIDVLAVSDIPGDEFSRIGSGPFSADAGSCGDVRRILDEAGVSLPATADRWLEDPAAETPKPGERIFERVRERIIACNADALAAAAGAARAAGYEPVILGDDLEGEAAELGGEHSRLALEYRNRGGRFALISGGETTVTLGKSSGAGGRNSEYLLGLALALDGAAAISAMAVDTDGIDGTEPAAGGWITPDSLDRARKAGIDPAVSLAEHRSAEFLSVQEQQIMTGPTGTNVNDLRVILVTSDTMECDNQAP